jgi:agmatinase
VFLGRAHLYAPATGTPEIGGFTSRGVQKFVRDLTDLEIVGCDVVEVYPAYDHAQITALLAANVAHEFLSLLAFSKKSVRLTRGYRSGACGGYTGMS